MRACSDVVERRKNMDGEDSGISDPFNATHEQVCFLFNFFSFQFLFLFAFLFNFFSFQFLFNFFFFLISFFYSFLYFNLSKVAHFAELYSTLISI